MSTADYAGAVGAGDDALLAWERWRQQCIQNGVIGHYPTEPPPWFTVGYGAGVQRQAAEHARLVAALAEVTDAYEAFSVNARYNPKSHQELVQRCRAALAESGGGDAH